MEDIAPPLTHARTQHTSSTDPPIQAAGALLEAFPADGDPTELGGRAIAYVVLAGVPLALAFKAFRAFLPVLTLLLRAGLALGGVVALTAIYDAYMV
tara:strand:+ start:365 stop:655 length:291 start_codon:yes stop_codon:yes gene_type:complete|eukprot:scaffold91478_cov36-Phaeocystis_antarctica.AAC.1